MYAQPTLLHANPEALADQLSALQSLLNCSQPVLNRVVGHNPSLLITNAELIGSKLQVLAQVFNTTVEEATAVATVRAPGLLTLSVKNIEASFAELQLLVPLGNPHRLAMRAPSLLAYSRDTLQHKVYELQRCLGLPPHGVVKLVSLAPSLLTCAVESNLEPKIRELQVLFARKAATKEAWRQAEARRTMSALTVLSGGQPLGATRPPPRKTTNFIGSTRGVSTRKSGASSGGKASAILQSRLKLKMAQSTFAGAGSSSSSNKFTMNESPATTAAASGDDLGSSTGKSSSLGDGNNGRELLIPLLPRDEAVRLVCSEPTLLQRNVSQSLAPKLALLRHLMQPVLPIEEKADQEASKTVATVEATKSGAKLLRVPDGACVLAAAADEVIRSQPRLLLSSYGVIGRVAFLAHVAHASSGSSSRETDASSDQGQQPIEAAVSSATVKSAIREPRARFFVRYPDYAPYLRDQLRNHQPTVPEEELEALSFAQLESKHGDILKASSL